MKKDPRTIVWEKKNKELEGKTFGHLLIIRTFIKKEGRAICQCSCGKVKEVAIRHLKSGRTMSCGHIGRENALKGSLKHGKRRTRIYSIWCNMKRRCDVEKNHNYKYYGGRGISYDPSWKEFNNFYEDMGDPPKGKTLDRIDNDGNYCKENCRWATPQEQARNTKSYYAAHSK